MDALKLYCEMGGTRKFIGEAQSLEDCAYLIFTDCKSRFTVPKDFRNLEFRNHSKFALQPETEGGPVYLLEKE